MALSETWGCVALSMLLMARTQNVIWFNTLEGSLMTQTEFLHADEARNWAYGVTEGFISRIKALIRWTMASEPRSMEPNPIQQIEPQQAFDLFYFYLTSVEVIAQHLSYSLVVPLPAHDLVNPFNFPNIDETQVSNFIQSGLAHEFLNRIRQKSSSQGTPFDVSYSYTILKFAIDEQKRPLVGDGNLSWLPSEDNLAWIAEGKGDIHPSNRQLVDEGKVMDYYEEQYRRVRRK